MTRYPSILLIPLFLAGFVTTGCQTTVGNYFANRGRDFGECFRAQAGLTAGLGISASAGGLVDLPLVAAWAPRKWGVGWVYGMGYLAEGGVGDMELAASDFDVGPLLAWSLRNEGKPIDLHIRAGPDPRSSVHRCWLFLPALLSRVEATDYPWIWSAEAMRGNPFAHVHAFDIEAGVYLVSKQA